MDKNRIIKNIVSMSKKNVLNIPSITASVAKAVVDFIESRNKELLQEKQHFIIFELTIDMLQSALAIDEKKAWLLYNDIQESRKNVSITTFMQAMCIGKIGEEIGKFLSKKFDSLYAMDDMLDPEINTEEEIQEAKDLLLEIDGFGTTRINIVTSKKFWDIANELSYYISPKGWRRPVKEMLAS